MMKLIPKVSDDVVTLTAISLFIITSPLWISAIFGWFVYHSIIEMYQGIRDGFKILAARYKSNGFSSLL